MKIAINGFGRIGRVFFRQAVKNPDFEIVAINDLGDKENLVYLLEHDSVYGRWKVDDKKWREVKFFEERDPSKLPWKDLEIDVVVESSGLFTSYDEAKKHLLSGAKRVVVTAPSESAEDTSGNKIITFTPNVGLDAVDKGLITSNASCTTNSVTPVMAIMMKDPGVEKAVLTTVHSYTASQGIVDRPDKKDWRRGRAGASNISPSTTGAAIATTQAIKEMAGKFDAVAVRVPVIAGSLSDFTFVSRRKTTADEINKIFESASKSPEWLGIIKIADSGTVSSDVLGEPYGAIIDTSFTRVIEGDLVKVFSWYDNEWGYCAMLIKHIEALKPYL